MPRIREISERHRDNPERVRREVAEQQAASGATVFAGCLPTLAQLPFLWVLYSLFSTAIVAGRSNQLLAGTLLGAPLGVHWPLFATTPAYLGLAVLLAVVAYFSSRRHVRLLDETASPLSRRLTRLLPFGTLATAAFIPLAAGLYLLTTTTWTLLERTLLQR
jgi:YidC/Oxa1 family membrane protein insertase